MKCFAHLLLIALLAVPITANEFEVFDFPASAFAIGHGSVLGFGGDSASLFSNPASMKLIEEKTSVASFFTSAMQNKTQYLFTSVSSKMPFGSIAIGFAQNRIDGATLTALDTNTDTPYVTGHFGLKKSILKTAVQLDVSPVLSAGFGLSHYSSELHTTTAQGFALDFSALISLGKTQLSLINQNPFSNDISYSNGGKETLPNILAFGLKTSVLDDLDVFAQSKSNGSSANTLSYGLNYSPLFLGETLSVSTGLNSYTYLGQYKQRFSFGLSIDIGPIGIDYAYSPTDYILQNENHFISTNFNF
jgi:hypothetical protein